jgi:hypothetical protein
MSEVDDPHIKPGVGRKEQCAVVSGALWSILGNLMVRGSKKWQLGQSVYKGVCQVS